MDWAFSKVVGILAKIFLSKCFSLLLAISHFLFKGLGLRLNITPTCLSYDYEAVYL